MSEALLKALPETQAGTQPSAIWYTRCPVPTTSGIAQHKRWLQNEFARHGITLDSIRASEDRAVRESHFRHSLAGSFREGGNVPSIWARALGQDTVVVGITWVDEEQQVFVRGDSDIQTVADLRGRKLGIVRKAASDLVDVGRAEGLRGLLTALELGGVPRDSVEFVDIAGPEWDLKEVSKTREDHHALPTLALLNGTVDAIFIKGAGSARALAQGLRPIININEQEDPLLRLSAGSPRPITVDRQTLIDSPQIVVRYLAVLLKTYEWAKDHPQDVVTTIAAETGTDADSVLLAFGEKLHLAFEPKLSELYVEGLRRQKDFLLAEGFIKQDFDIDSWIAPGPLQQAWAIKDEIVLD
ncbi:ABC transporter substrate-binding protein [Pseudomonas sp. 7P_10.2_Bac1]|uniref:ABC transporter substrate-binding protein n=1 Tax=Pseudomonas sp. 7P_10.2_Bac1 TaxID=2971614 RepID=UPI0021C60D34|nr:ABC transporter substrate-binding protein [Pseudomonas sp. 7P_10.2_Bac1]MCU1726852.1 ABC transporter substrate-binding protein [Pseudomonas sp. 7P_10.2_Bac1]